MPDYQNGRIYCIRAPGTDECYIGSTTIPLSLRMAQHRRGFKCWKENKGTCTTSYKLLEHEGAYIELIEEFPCATKEQLNKREGEVIRTTTNCVNRCIAGRTNNEYRAEHKEQIAKQRAAQYAAQREQIAAYNAAHKEQIAEKSAAYWVSNKDKYNASRRAHYAAKRAAKESPTQSDEPHK